MFYFSYHGHVTVYDLDFDTTPRIRRRDGESAGADFLNIDRRFPMSGTCQFACLTNPSFSCPDWFARSRPPMSKQSVG